MLILLVVRLDKVFVLISFHWIYFDRISVNGCVNRPVVYPLNLLVIIQTTIISLTHLVLMLWLLYAKLLQL